MSSIAWFDRAEMVKPCVARNLGVRSADSTDFDALGMVGGQTHANPFWFHMGDFGKHLEGSDPWENFFRTRQALKDAMGALRRL